MTQTCSHGASVKGNTTPQPASRQPRTQRKRASANSTPRWNRSMAEALGLMDSPNSFATTIFKSRMVVVDATDTTVRLGDSDDAMVRSTRMSRAGFNS
jgi:hypothetical protein